jgi:spermidine/putrescine transport system permease protein
MMGVTNIPMMNADIVTAIALMLLFIKFSSTGLMEFGFGTVLLAHITFCLPYVVLCVMPKLAQMDQHIYEAALDLGASPIYAFFKVILPDIFPGVLTGFLMSFTMSLDDFVITHFTKGAGVDTISTKVYTEVRKGIKPEMYALSTLLFVTVLVLLLLVNHRSAKQAKKSA